MVVDILVVFGSDIHFSFLFLIVKADTICCRKKQRNRDSKQIEGWGNIMVSRGGNFQLDPLHDSKPAQEKHDPNMHD